MGAPPPLCLPPPVAFVGVDVGGVEDDDDEAFGTRAAAFSWATPFAAAAFACAVPEWLSSADAEETRR